MADDMNRQRQEEQEAVRTTIVGGRPPGCGKSVGSVPRGIEVLVKKAAVDPEFRSLLLSRRGEAARSIGLELSPAENMMLSAAPAGQLQAIIAATTVPPSHVPAFLGKVAAVMLAAMGIVQCGCDNSSSPKPVGAGPEGGTRDNVAATSRPAAPADDQPLTIAGAVIVKPLTRPTTQTTEPVYVLGIRPDNPAPAASERIAGERIDRPPAPSASDNGPGPILIAGDRVDRPPMPSTAPATEPAQDQSPRVGSIAGLGIGRPQDTVIRGLRADVPPAVPPTQPATESATEPAAAPAVPVFGVRPRSAAESSSAPPPVVFGLIPDRPAVIKGLRIDRPDEPTTAPATQPTTRPAIEPAQPSEPEFPIPIDGIRPDRPRRSE